MEKRKGAGKRRTMRYLLKIALILFGYVLLVWTYRAGVFSPDRRVLKSPAVSRAAETSGIKAYERNVKDEGNENDSREKQNLNYRGREINSRYFTVRP